jgi:hypothetical protein
VSGDSAYGEKVLHGSAGTNSLVSFVTVSNDRWSTIVSFVGALVRY